MEPTLAADPVQTDDLGAVSGQAPVAGDASASSATPAYTTTPLPAGGLDVELSGEHATDEVARIDLAEVV